MSHSTGGSSFLYPYFATHLTEYKKSSPELTPEEGQELLSESCFQGDYAYLQCREGCHDKLYYNEDLVKEMVAKTVDCRIPTELVPVCPVNGEPMNIHVRMDEHFVQDQAWYKARDAFSNFMKESEDKLLILLSRQRNRIHPG